LDDWLIELWVFNKQEQNINAVMHQSVLNKYLTMCGYKVVGFIGKKFWEHDKSSLKFGGGEYDQIKDLDIEEFKEIDTLIKSGDASQNQKKLHKKFKFDEFVLSDQKSLDLLAK
jgi:hypothetical protein